MVLLGKQLRTRGGLLTSGDLKLLVRQPVLGEQVVSALRAGVTNLC